MFDESVPNCTVYRLRMAARRATRLYDRILAPSGLGITQFGLLMTVQARDGASVSEIADALDMDRTTLTRNLRPLVRGGYLALSKGSDLRRKAVHITEKGDTAITQAEPLWRKAQRTVAESLGGERTQLLHELLEEALTKLHFGQSS